MNMLSVEEKDVKHHCTCTEDRSCKHGAVGHLEASWAVCPLTSLVLQVRPPCSISSVAVSRLVLPLAIGEAMSGKGRGHKYYPGMWLPWCLRGFLSEAEGMLLFTSGTDSEFCSRLTAGEINGVKFNSFEPTKKLNIFNHTAFCY